jgi:menaquinone-dependent protoporphyrinogen oxidase
MSVRHTKVLVTAASRHGATLGIAETIARGLQQRGLDARSARAEEVQAVDGNDAIVLGSAVYYGHWLEAANKLAEDHAAALAERPVWLFSSGPLGEPGHQLRECDAIDVAALIEATNAVEHRTFAGKLDKAQLPFREKAVAVALRAPEGDFRDWGAVDAFAAEIAQRLGAANGG